MSDNHFTEEQLEEINRRMNADAIQGTREETAEPKKEEVEAVEEAEPSKDEPADTVSGITEDSLKSMLADAIKTINSDGENKAISLMWNQQLSSAFSTTPGFEQFMNSTDDYGKPRLDQINKIEDYAERVNALANIRSRFAQAQSQSRTGGDPLIDRKTVERAKKFQDKYNELDTKLKSGEYASKADFRADSLKLISEEMNALMGK